MKYILLLTLFFLPNLTYGIEICDDRAAINVEDIHDIQNTLNILKYSYTYMNKTSYYRLDISNATKHHLNHANSSDYTYTGDRLENGDYVFSVDCTPKTIIPYKGKRKVPLKKNRNIICNEKHFFKLILISDTLSDPYIKLYDYISSIKKLPLNKVYTILQEEQVRQLYVDAPVSFKYIVVLHILAQWDKMAKLTLRLLANNNPNYDFEDNTEDNKNIKYILKQYLL